MNVLRLAFLAASGDLGTEAIRFCQVLDGPEEPVGRGGAGMTLYFDLEALAFGAAINGWDLAPVELISGRVADDRERKKKLARSVFLFSSPFSLNHSSPLNHL